MKEVNTSGLSCPEPVLRAQEAIKKMSKGEKLRVVADNETAKENILRLLTKNKCKSTVLQENDLYFIDVEVG